jgi:hypothetical protein
MGKECSGGNNQARKEVYTKGESWLVAKHCLLTYLFQSSWESQQLGPHLLYAEKYAELRQKWIKSAPPGETRAKEDFVPPQVSSCHLLGGDLD